MNNAAGKRHCKQDLQELQSTTHLGVALPAQGTMLPSGLRAKGTLERAGNSGTMLAGVFPSWYKVQRYPGYVLTG